MKTDLNSVVYAKKTKMLPGTARPTEKGVFKRFNKVLVISCNSINGTFDVTSEMTMLNHLDKLHLIKTLQTPASSKLD